MKILSKTSTELIQHKIEQWSDPPQKFNSKF